MSGADLSEKAVKSLHLYSVAVALPFSLFVLHALSLGDWIIDDAGISYTYARNLAEGNGLVAQPGAEPVEGFTNLLWVLLLALPMRLGFFDTVSTPKVISGLMVLVGYVAMAAVARRLADRWVWLCFTSLSITSLSTGFVAWTMSGLENGLYALLVALLVLGVVVATAHSSTRSESGVVLGLAVLLLFVTRPDGILYLPLFPVLLALALRENRRRAALAYTLVVALGWGVLTLFRLAYFADVLPNSYYAKGGPLWELTASTLDSKGPLLGGGILLLAGVIVIVAGTIGPYWLAEKTGGWKSLRRTCFAALWVALAISWVAYAALPTDWMPEFRFATPAFLLGPVTIIGSLAGVAKRFTRPVARPVWLSATAVVAAIGIAVAVGFVRTSSFKSSPPVPFEHALTLSERLERVGRLSGRTRVSVLLPDIGGPLWRDQVRVVDLAGLTDPVIARTQKRSKPEFYNYVFEEVRPELIWVHGQWVQAAGLDADRRFVTHYRRVWRDRKNKAPGAALYARKEAFEVPMTLLRRAFVKGVALGVTGGSYKETP